MISGAPRCPEELLRVLMCLRYWSHLEGTGAAGWGHGGWGRGATGGPPIIMHHAWLIIHLEVSVRLRTTIKDYTISGIANGLRMENKYGACSQRVSTDGRCTLTVTARHEAMLVNVD